MSRCVHIGSHRPSFAFPPGGSAIACRAQRMALQLFNTLTRQVEEFRPFDEAGKTVGMYCCGPTVYDHGHIGNFRTFVFADLVRRYLTFRGFTVNHVMNITDVEDKIIKPRARENGNHPEVNSPANTRSRLPATIFKALGCREPAGDRTCRARRNTSLEIIALIEKLDRARHRLQSATDGSVYFSASTKYQRLRLPSMASSLKLNFDEMRAGERVASATNTKRNPSPTSPCGRRACRMTATCPGPARGARADLAGTSSAAR